MKTLELEVVSEHLAELVDRAAHGESFLIAKAGHAMVRVEALVDRTPESIGVPGKRRLGGLREQGIFPPTREAFKAIGREEIEAMFYGESE